ncbi:type II toxin-antitoxin system HipA family toxin [Maridesulfovibrio ferrireducens]|uniref:type II toxin-antitoxin system HipA family toxin n=1 Tax=Maridesulfovibrio ferrireducens TaxID=246191 RepID=UPI001A309045|nr:type II toxin-antitoxin system HipA family toxin [Maridesulfovibrio ferrireducens]MBI9113376.1 type II toxin-antitoxin system HipA family toxin [Maridesulfovibrio ferrireducens]
MTQKKAVHEKLDVFGNFGSVRHHVGVLAVRDGEIYFEYTDDFLQTGMEISPFKLPTKNQFVHCKSPFESLPGVFYDSLPDGWGRLLMERVLRGKGIHPSQITPLDRLAFVGISGLGALEYEPAVSQSRARELSLDEIAGYAKNVLAEELSGTPQDVIEALLHLNGSSAGARPKVLVSVFEDGTLNCSPLSGSAGNTDLNRGAEAWMVKFPNTHDGRDSGALEYVYSIMARKAGIEMPPTRLFSAKDGPGYFGIKRFDVTPHERFHMHTACGLLEADYRVPALDYQDLIKLTYILTKNQQEVEKIYRLAVFNVLAHNRDDHGKNFTYLMGKSGQWSFAPAYDLTYSHGPNGEQSTMVMGEGRSPGKEHLMALAEVADISEKKAGQCIEQVEDSLSEFGKLAGEYGVSADLGPQL